MKEKELKDLLRNNQDSGAQIFYDHDVHEWVCRIGIGDTKKAEGVGLTIEGAIRCAIYDWYNGNRKTSKCPICGASHTLHDEKM